MVPLPRAFRLAAASLALVASGAADASAQNAGSPKRGGVLEFAVDAEPPSYDCHANVSFAFLHPVAPHYSTLLKFDGADYPQVKGDLAESWSVSADKLTYTFKLRPDVLFHDGSRLTAADVKASYERIAHPPEGVVSARQVGYASISAIDTPDARTVVFRLKWPEASMLANFASPWNCIYSAPKLKEDPLFPKTHIFVAGAKVIDGIEQHRIMAEFRSITPTERDRLVEGMGDKVYIGETPWLIDLIV